MNELTICADRLQWATLTSTRRIQLRKSDKPVDEPDLMWGRSANSTETFWCRGPRGYYYCWHSHPQLLHKEARPVGSKLQPTSVQLHCYNCENEFIMKLCAECFYHELFLDQPAQSGVFTDLYPQVECLFFALRFQLHISHYYYNETTWWAK